MGRTMRIFVAPGPVEVTWRPDTAPTGIYYYRLETDDGVEIRPMSYRK
jgi:hypothetical protein